jgi:hypothetical protein
VQRQTLQPQANPQAVVHRRAVPRHRADLWVLQAQAQGQEAAALWVQEAQGQEAQGVQEVQVVVLSPDYEF